MEWLAENWFWLLVFLACIGMHMGHGHSRHGTHGGHGHGGSGPRRKAGSDRGGGHVGH